jgi:hypothetical protein
LIREGNEPFGASQGSTGVLEQGDRRVGDSGKFRFPAPAADYARRMAFGRPEPRTSAYLAERYWPGLDEPAAQRAVRRLMEQAVAAGEAATTTVLTCTFVPREQAVLVLLIAGSGDDVAELGLRADLRFDRIVDAVVLSTARPRRDGSAVEAESRRARR